MTTPKPGDIGFATIAGFTGFWVRIGQTIAGDGSRYTHTYTVLDNDEVLEAEPGGARITPLAYYEGLPFLDTQLNDAQRIAAARIGRGLEGTPYSFLDYLYLALVHFHLPSKRLREKVKSSGHMICSQQSDFIQCQIGNHLFDDGRLSQDVTPGDIANILLERNTIHSDTPLPEGYVYNLPLWQRLWTKFRGRKS